MTIRQRIALAMRQGSEAGHAGEPMTACPYDVRSPDLLEQTLATLWLRAHDRAAPAPVDYGEDRGTDG